MLGRTTPAERQSNYLLKESFIKETYFFPKNFSFSERIFFFLYTIFRKKVLFQLFKAFLDECITDGIWIASHYNSALIN